MAYTTSGSVRGDCGHRHRTLAGAIRCLDRDRDGCQSQGGYSDRRVLNLATGEVLCTVTDEDTGDTIVEDYAEY